LRGDTSHLEAWRLFDMMTFVRHGRFASSKKGSVLVPTVEKDIWPK
jgi:hypothetical protein